MSLVTAEDRVPILRRSLFGVLPDQALLQMATDVRETRLLWLHLLYEPEVAVVATGGLRAFVADGNLRQLAVSYLAPGTAVAVARHAGRLYPTAFQAVRDTRMLVVGNEYFSDLLIRHPVLGWSAAREIASRLNDVQAELGRVAFGSLRQRIAFHLLMIDNLEDSPPAPVHLGVLSAAIASPREVISRVLGPMAREGLLRVDPGGVTVLDRQRLLREAELA